MALFENIQNELLKRIEVADKSLKIAVAWFTNHNLFDALLKKLDRPEFKIDLIVLNDKINNKNEGVNFQKLIDKGGNFYYSDTERMVHHKFCIIDDHVVITGSYNWTYFAENRNWENVVILTETDTVLAYRLEFDKIKSMHKQVFDVSTKRLLNIAIDTANYLETDYFFQAKNEEAKGNSVAAAKVYTEILRENNKRADILAVRNNIIKQHENQLFEFSPFEIGIQLQSGYTPITPAYTPLPAKNTIVGHATKENQTKAHIEIQKNDYKIGTMEVLAIEHLKPTPKGMGLVELELSLSAYGILHILCKSVGNGFIKKTFTIDLKNHL